jgi:hypothetical protein
MAIQNLATITNIQDALFLAFSNVLTTLLSFVPNLIAAAIVMLIGILVARWSRWLTIKILKTINLTRILRGTVIEKFLEKADITSKVEVYIGNIVKWFILLIFFITTINLLGLTTVSLFLTNILSYLPKVVSAALILMLGVLFAGAIESIIKGALSPVSVSTARFTAKIASYVVMIFTLLAVLSELGIATDLIHTLFIGIVAMLSLGFGLAFGLGAKDLVAKILDQWYKSMKKELE